MLCSGDKRSGLCLGLLCFFRWNRSFCFLRAAFLLLFPSLPFPRWGLQIVNCATIWKNKTTFRWKRTYFAEKLSIFARMFRTFWRVWSGEKEKWSTFCTDGRWWRRKGFRKRRYAFHCVAINVYLCRVIVILLFNLLHDLLCRRSFSSYVFPNKFRFSLVEARSPVA